MPAAVVRTFPLDTPTVFVALDGRGVGRIELRRPQAGNAYDAAMLSGIVQAAHALSREAGLRVVVLSGQGAHFQSGADLAWVDALSRASADENLHASRLTADALAAMGRLEVPVIAAVRGRCFGGGTGLAASCDVVVADGSARFSVAEVRWGLTPSFILPALAAAVGPGQAKRLALTAEEIDATQAQAIGLVHRRVEPDALDAEVERIVDRVLDNAPDALRRTKADLRQLAEQAADAQAIERLIQAHAAKRASEEARRGLAAFRARTRPDWNA